MSSKTKQKKPAKQAHIGRERARICNDVVRAAGITEPRLLHLPRLLHFAANENVVAGKFEVASSEADSTHLDYYYLHLDSATIWRYHYEGTAEGFWRWMKSFPSGTPPKSELTTTCELPGDLNVALPPLPSLMGQATRCRSTSAAGLQGSDLAVSTRGKPTLSFSPSKLSTSASACPLLQLPRELRDIIYGYVSSGTLVVRRQFGRSEPNLVLTPHTTSACQASQVLRREMGEFLRSRSTPVPYLAMLAPSDVSHPEMYQAQLRPTDTVCFAFQKLPSQDDLDFFLRWLPSWLSICQIRLLFNVPTEEGYQEHIKNSYIRSKLLDNKDRLELIVKRALRLHDDSYPPEQSEFFIYYKLDRHTWLQHCLRDREELAECAVILDFAKPSASTPVLRSLGWTYFASARISAKERDILRRWLPDFASHSYSIEPWKRY